MRPNPWGIQGIGNVIGPRIFFGRGAPGYFQTDEGAMRNLQDQNLARLAQDHNSDTYRNGSGDAPANTYFDDRVIRSSPEQSQSEGERSGVCKAIHGSSEVDGCLEGPQGAAAPSSAGRRGSLYCADGPAPGR